jgi:hypothetical protein
MALLLNTSSFPQNESRRSFLGTLGALALTVRAGKSEKRSETIYRFLTPEYEVRMTVQYFGNFLTKGFRF